VLLALRKSRGKVADQEASIDTRALVGARALRGGEPGEERDEKRAHIVSV
jgi:hypothetical protein